MKTKSLFLLTLVSPLLIGCNPFKSLPHNLSPEEYYQSKKLSLKKAESHESEVDQLFDYLSTFAKQSKIDESGSKKFGKKFFLAIVQEGCAECEDRAGAFITLEKKWGKGEDFALDGDNGLGNEPFKMFTIYADTENDDGENLFETVYDRMEVGEFFETTISYMEGDHNPHPYYLYGNESGYEINLHNLLQREELTTPATFLIDLTNPRDWRSPYGVCETLFTYSGTDGTDDIAKAKTLRNAWTNNPSNDNVFSKNYQG